MDVVLRPLVDDWHEILCDGMRIGLVRPRSVGGIEDALRGQDVLRDRLGRVRAALDHCLLLFPEAGAFSPMVRQDGTVHIIAEKWRVFIGNDCLHFPLVDREYRGRNAPRDPAREDALRAGFLTNCSGPPTEWFVRGPDDPLLDTIPATPAETLSDARRLFQNALTAAGLFRDGMPFTLYGDRWRRPDDLSAVGVVGEIWSAVAETLAVTHGGRREVSPVARNYHLAGAHWAPLEFPVGNGPFSAQEIAAARRFVSAHPLVSRAIQVGLSDASSNQGALP